MEKESDREKPKARYGRENVAFSRKQLSNEQIKQIVKGKLNNKKQETTVVAKY